MANQKSEYEGYSIYNGRLGFVPDNCRKTFDDILTHLNALFTYQAYMKVKTLGEIEGKKPFERKDPGQPIRLIKTGLGYIAASFPQANFREIELINSSVCSLFGHECSPAIEDYIENNL